MRWGARLVAWAVACVAACGGGTGVDIDIFVPDGVKVDRVELWVAYDQCYDCPNGVAWTQTDRTTGNIYFLRDEGLIKADLKGDRWVLHLDAQLGYSDPPWIAIVGYDAGKATAVKVLRDVHIPISKVVMWHVDLHPAEPATTDVSMVPPSDGTRDYRAHVWARAPTPALAEPTGCLVYQKWTGSDWETEYFVPKTDPDCDGVPVEKECSEYWYNYKPLGSCVTNMTEQLTGACLIGVSACADGVTSDKTCLADPQRPPTCLPDAFCHYCSGEIPADTCAAQAVEQGLSEDVLAHYDCPLDETTASTACPGQYATMQLPFVQSPCGTPTLHYVDRPFTDPKPDLTFGIAPDDVKLTAKLHTGLACVLDLYWVGSATAFRDGVNFLVEVPYDNGTRAIYPITVYPSNQTAVCSINPVINQCMPSGPTDDRVGACAGKLGP